MRSGGIWPSSMTWQEGSQTLPDGREIGYIYDLNGNVTSITPPGQPPHVFEYTPLDLEAEYNPPPVDAQTPRLAIATTATGS